MTTGVYYGHRTSVGDGGYFPSDDDIERTNNSRTGGGRTTGNSGSTGNNGTNQTTSHNGPSYDDCQYGEVYDDYSDCTTDCEHNYYKNDNDYKCCGDEDDRYANKGYESFMTEYQEYQGIRQEAMLAQQQMMEEQMQKQQKAAKGALIGAAIGTAICPGVGTLIGGILGSFF